MLLLRMYRVQVSEQKIEKLDSFIDELASQLRSFVAPVRAAQAQVFGLDPSRIRRSRSSRQDSFEPTSPLPVKGEIFTDGTTVIVLSVSADHQRRALRGRRVDQAESGEKGLFNVYLYAIGPAWDSPALTKALDRARAEDVLGSKLKPFTYKLERFDSLKAEGRESPPETTATELKACELLAERLARTLSVAIKASGGLLVRDLAKQLPAESRDKAEMLAEELKAAGIVDSEIVVVCTKTQSQVTRAPNRSILEELSARGLKCACGRILCEERIEEALTITDLGRSLLDKARWLTVILLQELGRVGISRDAILVEQNVGGDEIDCLANISGELALFELKDKEFSLGNAYSFGAKIGIIRPDYSVVVTTEHVGNDAKEHFVRARRSSRAEFEHVQFDSDTNEIVYIEGVDNIRAAIEGLVSAIYASDAARELDRVLGLAALDGRSLLRALETPTQSESGSEKRRSEKRA
jgi:hypothetical protein